MKVTQWTDDEKYQLVHISYALRIAVVIADISNEALAAKAGMSSSSLSRLLGNHSDNSNPQLLTIIRLAQALDLTLEQLLDLPANARRLLAEPSQVRGVPDTGVTPKGESK